MAKDRKRRGNASKGRRDERQSKGPRLRQIYPPGDKSVFPAAQGNLTVYAMEDREGSYPVYDWLANEMNNSEYQNFITTMLKRDGNPNYSDPVRFKKIENTDLIAYKKHQHRLIGFYDGKGRIVFVMALRKQQDLYKQSELKRAKSLKARYEGK